MKNEITVSHANVPAEVSTEIRLLSTSPAKYLENLPVERIDAERPPGAITLSHCKRSLTREQQLMYISLMIAEVNDFFNVKGNMNAKQIKLTAELILDNDNFYDLTLGNIKSCFRQHMMQDKIYDRLDGNIIIGWLREFKSEMADRCETFNEGKDRMRLRKESGDGAGSISHTVYMAMLEARANDGDEDAARTLAEYRRRAAMPTAEEQRRKDLGFFAFNEQYKKKKGYYDRNKSKEDPSGPQP